MNTNPTAVDTRCTHVYDAPGNPRCIRTATHVVVQHDEPNHDGNPVCVSHALDDLRECLDAEPLGAYRVEPLDFDPHA